MSKQWGHGFHAGKHEGQRFGELIEGGKWEIELSDVSARLILIANSLRFPVEFQAGRTETWWKLYVHAAAKQIEQIAKELPGTLNGVYEFEKEIPDDKA